MSNITQLQASDGMHQTPCGEFESASKLMGEPASGSGDTLFSPLCRRTPHETEMSVVALYRAALMEIQYICKDPDKTSFRNINEICLHALNPTFPYNAPLLFTVQPIPNNQAAIMVVTNNTDAVWFVGTGEVLEAAVAECKQIAEKLNGVFLDNRETPTTTQPPQSTSHG